MNDTSIADFDPDKQSGPRATEQLGAVIVTSGHSELQIGVNMALGVVGSMVGATLGEFLAWGSWPLALFCGGCLVYGLGLYVWDRRSKDILKALPDSVVIEHRRLSSTVTTIPMSTIKSVEVVDQFMRSALRFRLVDTTRHDVVLGQRADHVAIANWLRDRLAGRQLIEPSAIADVIPEQLRNLRIATATLSKT